MNSEEKLVAHIGNQIGFGRLMHLASAQWRDLLEKHGGSGGEFMVGTCAAMVVPCDHNGVAGHTCDWCCGSGWVTQRVAQAMAEDRARK